MDPVTSAILAFVTVERLGELAWARANTARLRADGAREAGAGHYPAMVALHSAWLAGLWLCARGRPVEPAFIAIFAAAQVGRVWVLWALGRRWTTRIVVVPGERLIARGPYRVLRHPNYLVVAVEIAALPLSFGLVVYALVFSLLNAAVLAVRIRAEDRALEALRQAEGIVRPIGRGRQAGRPG